MKIIYCICWTKNIKINSFFLFDKKKDLYQTPPYTTWINESNGLSQSTNAGKIGSGGAEVSFELRDNWKELRFHLILFVFFFFLYNDEYKTNYDSAKPLVTN